jgi:hypothetical protein
MWPFSTAPVRPSTISTDTIIPVYPKDDNDIYRAIVLDFTLRFDDVLDPLKVSGALRRLMELGNWRKLGARIRLNVSEPPELNILSHEESHTDRARMLESWNIMFLSHLLLNGLDLNTPISKMTAA